MPSRVGRLQHADGHPHALFEAQLLVGCGSRLNVTVHCEVGHEVTAGQAQARLVSDGGQGGDRPAVSRRPTRLDTLPVPAGELDR
jgi:hypothetical protein